MEIQTRPSHEPEDALDAVLRTELSWQAPPDLSSRLVALAQQQSFSAVAATAETLATPADPIHHGPVLIDDSPTQPRTAYSIMVIVLTSIAVGLSLTVAWRFYDIIIAELGLIGVWNQVQATMALALDWLYAELPASRQVVSVLGSAYEQVYWLLNWLLVAIVLWLALDGYSTGGSVQQQQQTQTS